VNGASGTIDRKKLMWLAVGGGALVIGLLFISVLAPSPHPGETGPDITTGRTAEEAFAGATATPATESATSSGGFHPGGGEAVSLIWRLGLVVVIIGGSVMGLRWWGKRVSAPKSQTGYVRVVDTLPISNGRSIHLVALGKRVIAVGATASQMSLLTELDDDESADVLGRLPEASDGPLSNFASELMHSLQRGGNSVRREVRRMPVRGDE
jgi:flagellar biogenesis protein FliO